MDHGELKRSLQEYVDREVSVTFTDGVVLRVTVLTVDDEGFVYDMEENGCQVGCWTSVADVESLRTSSVG